MEKESQKRGRGRPRIELDEKKVAKLAGIGCTIPEIAAVLNCSKRTLEANYRTIIAKGWEEMRQSVRRMQYKSAQGGSVAMQIWLGKQYLGQREKTDMTSDGAALLNRVTVTIVGGEAGTEGKGNEGL